MTVTALARTITLTTLLAAGVSSGAALAQATGQGQAAPTTQPGTTGQGMMGRGAMGQGMMGQGMMCPMMGQGMGGMAGMGMMPGGGRMRLMFAIADANSDDALSFDEVTAFHKRLFDAMDTNNDGRVTAEELRTFLQG